MNINKMKLLGIIIASVISTGAYSQDTKKITDDFAKQANQTNQDFKKIIENIEKANADLEPYLQTNTGYYNRKKINDHNQDLNKFFDDELKRSNQNLKKTIENIEKANADLEPYLQTNTGYYNRKSKPTNYDKRIENDMLEHLQLIKESLPIKMSEIQTLVGLYINTENKVVIETYQMDTYVNAKSQVLVDIFLKQQRKILCEEYKYALSVSNYNTVIIIEFKDKTFKFNIEEECLPSTKYMSRF